MSLKVTDYQSQLTIFVDLLTFDPDSDGRPSIFLTLTNWPTMSEN